MTARLPVPGFDPADFTEEFVAFAPGERPIRPADYEVAAAVWSACIAAVLDAKYDRGTLLAAELRRAAGMAVASATTLMRSLSFGAEAKSVVDAARKAGVDRSAFYDLRRKLAAMSGGNGLGAMVLTLFVRLCLAAEARCLAETEFTSRQDVDAAVAEMRDAFESVLDYAAERRDADVFQAFATLYADTIRDLTERSRALPKMTSYATAETTPSLRLACRLYNDGARANELEAENKVVNPIFMPRSGRALAF